MTVFVLGAGSNVEYGFPSGASLVQLIVEETSALIPSLYSYLPEDALRRVRGLSEDFTKALRDAEALSIDSFLQSNSPFLDMGKRAIFWQILKAEKDCQVRSGLYQHLYRRLSRIENWMDKYRFITFNYDRSLEHYLGKMLVLNNVKSHTRYSLTVEQDRMIAESADTLPIIHVHGSLGSLKSVPYSSGGFEKAEYFLNTNNHGNFALFKETGEQNSTRQEFRDQIFAKNVEEVQKWIHEAERVVFLGFGYDRENLRKLGIPESLTKKYKPVMGTIYKMLPAEVDDVLEFFDMDIAQDHISGFFDARNENCLEFLKKQVWF